MKTINAVQKNFYEGWEQKIIDNGLGDISKEARDFLKEREEEEAKRIRAWEAKMADVAKGTVGETQVAAMAAGIKIANDSGVQDWVTINTANILEAAADPSADTGEKIQMLLAALDCLAKETRMWHLGVHKDTLTHSTLIINCLLAACADESHSGDDGGPTTEALKGYFNCLAHSAGSDVTGGMTFWYVSNYVWPRIGEWREQQAERLAKEALETGRVDVVETYEDLKRLAKEFAGEEPRDVIQMRRTVNAYRDLFYHPRD